MLIFCSVSIKSFNLFNFQMDNVIKQPCDDAEETGFQAIDFKNILVAFLILPIGISFSAAMLFAEKIWKGCVV
jgi:hypothetical protein